MDTFLSQKFCDRCGGSLAGGRIQSVFNSDCLCLKCKEKERLHPDYPKAEKAEREAVLRGDFNFAGIGYDKSNASL